MSRFRKQLLFFCDGGFPFCCQTANDAVLHAGGSVKKMIWRLWYDKT